MKVHHIHYVHPVSKIEHKGCMIVPNGPLKGVIQLCHDRYDHIERYEMIMQKLSETGCAVFGFHMVDYGDKKMVSLPPQLMVDVIHDGFLEACNVLRERIQEAAKAGICLPHILIGFGFGALLTRLYVMKYEDVSALVLCGDEGFITHTSLLKKCRRLQKQPQAVDVTAVNFTIREVYNEYFAKNDSSRFAWRVADPAEQKRLEQDVYATKDYALSTIYDMTTLYKAIELKGWIEACPRELPIFIMSGYLDPCSRFTRNLDVLLKEMQRSALTNCFYRY